MKGEQVLVNICAKLTQKECALVVVTPATLDIGHELIKEISNITSKYSLVCMPEMEIHGMEPEFHVVQAMLCADVIFCLTPMSLAHSQARENATSNKSRFLSLPDYSMALLSSPSLETDFDDLIPISDALANVLDEGKSVTVTSKMGTNIKFSIEGRAANRCPGIVAKAGELGSPPDAEVNIAPLEGYGNGVLVIDGSVPCPGVGVLETPLTLKVVNSVVTEVSSKDKRISKIVEDMFSKAGPKSRIIGEFGIGLNPNAKLCGIMLEDEGCAGTVHFGIGSNATIGGTNKVAFHVDFILRAPSVLVDGKLLIEAGELLVGAEK